MLALTPQQKAIVLNILQDHLPEGANIWVFGSRAVGTEKRSADLDLAIDLGRAMTRAEMASLCEAFELSDLPWRVDVVDRQTVSPAFDAIIARTAVVLG